jgi:deoxycytidylate deaminase
MKTIDTTKLWVVNPETDSGVPEICGPHGICMDVHGASTAQAQEIADMLNPTVGVEARLAEFKAPYSVNLREGDTEVTYSAPTAEEVMDMVARGEQRIEASPEKVEIKINSLGQLETKSAEQTLTEWFSKGMPFDESTKVVMHGARRAGKTHAMLVEAYLRLRAERTRANDLAACNERLKAELSEAVHLRNHWHEAFKSATERFEEADHGRRASEDNAAGYLRSMHWYQEQLDICGRALGVEAFTCDDGGRSESPVRAKVAELVVKLCAARHGPRITPEQADRFVTVTAIKRGPCAKQTVTATIVTPTGERFVGTNGCANPQATCPRDAAGMKTGEGYHLCDEVCQQTGHAEINALRAAGEKARGGILYIEGHTYACEPCRQAMDKAGITMYRFIAPPAETGSAEKAPAKDLPTRLRNLADAAQGKIWDSVTDIMRAAANELQKADEKTSTALGVGDGSGSLFVYGSYDAIKAVQRRFLRSTLPDISTLRHAFRTVETSGGHRMVLKFKDLKALHTAAEEFRALDHAADRDGE